MYNNFKIDNIGYTEISLVKLNLKYLENPQVLELSNINLSINFKKSFEFSMCIDDRGQLCVKLGDEADLH